MITAEAETATATATTEKPKATKKPRVGAQRAQVASAKAKAAKKGYLLQESAKGREESEWHP
jgi:hypothetical protein